MFIVVLTLIIGTEIVAITAHRICFLCALSVITGAITMNPEFHVSREYVETQCVKYITPPIY